MIDSLELDLDFIGVIEVFSLFFNRSEGDFINEETPDGIEFTLFIELLIEKASSLSDKDSIET